MAKKVLLGKWEHLQGEPTIHSLKSRSAEFCLGVGLRTKEVVATDAGEIVLEWIHPLSPSSQASSQGEGGREKMSEEEPLDEETKKLLEELPRGPMGKFDHRESQIIPPADEDPEWKQEYRFSWFPCVGEVKLVVARISKGFYRFWARTGKEWGTQWYYDRDDDSDGELPPKILYVMMYLID